MLFNSPAYLFVFLPVAVAVFFFLNRRRWLLAAKVWIVVASLVFYGVWNPRYLPLIIGSILVNFFLSQWLLKMSTGLAKRLALFAGVAFNLGLLGYFKYVDFFIANMNWLTEADWSLLHVVLPLAISFFTFQQVAYLVDSYQTGHARYDFLSYSLFVTFFPQLIAGPIVRHAEMIPQFERMRNRVVDWSNVARGVVVFSLGLFKKVVVADTFAVWANAGFGSTGDLTVLEAWAASLSYTLQLYFDFSGYSEMAIGAALLFNIRLPVNFNSPYKAVGIQEFWRRWHITLSTWLRDYLYIPLGGNRKGRSAAYANIMITFLLGGLWHGAGWTFVVWGAMHGVALCVQRLWRQTGIGLPRAIAWIVTLFFVNTAWIFFRAETFGQAMGMIEAMSGLGAAAGLSAQTLYGGLADPATVLGYVAVFTIVALALPNTLEVSRFIPSRFERWAFRPGLAAVVPLSLVIVACVVAILRSEPVEFLYFNF